MSLIVGGVFGTVCTMVSVSVDVSPDGRLMVGGHVPIESLGDHGVEIEDETVTSVGGLVFARLGKLPRTGDSVVSDGWRLTVEATRGTRVVLVSVVPESPAPGANGTALAAETP